MTEQKIVAKNDLKNFLENPAIVDKMHKVLGNNPQSFITTVLQIVSSNDLLSNATPASVYGAALTAATMKLPINPNLGFAYIVPYNNRKAGKQEAQFQIGWKGFVQLAQRSGEFESVNTTEIYENQFEGFDYITGDIKIKHEAPKGRVVGFLAYFSLKNGFKKTLYMSLEDVKKHATKYSQSYKKGFGVWADGDDGFNSMAKKTVLKLLLGRFAPLSIEMQTAIQSDQAVVEDVNEFDYIDNDHEPASVEDRKAAVIENQKENPVIELP